MVMYIPQRGSPEFYPREEIGQPDETSEVEVKSISLPSFGGGALPPKEELQKLPKTVLLRIAIELDPDAVSESYQEGWTKDDILRVIERHLKRTLGRAGEEGSEYIHDVEIIDSEIAEEQGPEAESPYERL